MNKLFCFCLRSSRVIFFFRLHFRKFQFLNPSAILCARKLLFAISKNCRKIQTRAAWALCTRITSRPRRPLSYRYVCCGSDMWCLVIGNTIQFTNDLNNTSKTTWLKNLDLKAKICHHSKQSFQKFFTSESLRAIKHTSSFSFCLPLQIFLTSLGYIKIEQTEDTLYLLLTNRIDANLILSSCWQSYGLRNLNSFLI